MASRIPGLVEVVGQDAGALVEPEDAGALADAVLARLTSPTRSAYEGEQAAVRAKLFDVTMTFEQLADVTRTTWQRR